MAVLLSLSITAWGQTRPDVPAAPGSADRLFPLDTTVNGQNVGTWPFLERAGVLYASAEALEEWRIRIAPGAQPIMVRGMRYWPLAGVPGYTAKPNYANQSVDLNFAPEAFTEARIVQPKQEALKVSPVLPSAFFNYEFNYNVTHTRGLDSTDLGALLEVGASNDWGVFTTSSVGRNLAGGTPGGEGAKLTRLESTFTHDFPESNHTLRLGDTSTRVGLWGRNVYYGGLQYGTNYSLTPGFLTNPVPIVRGVSTAPSTVELYVNGALRQVSQVQPGPFAIDNAAVLTGSGEARVVVRDILGREVVITQPFFTSNSLLAQGLTDWGIDAGALRLGLGQDSWHYGAGFTAGTWRYGVTDTLTTEARAEVTSRMRAAGVGLVNVLPGNILGRAALAVSDQDGVGTGHQWTLGFEKHWLSTSVYAQAQGASSSFRSLGLGDNVLASRDQWVVNLTHTTHDWGNFGFAIAGLRPWFQQASTTVSATYSLRVAGNSTLTANLGRVYGSGAGTTAGVMLQVPLDQARQITATVQHHGGRFDAYATASQTAGLDSDFGWRVLGGWLSDQPHAEGGVFYRGRFGNLYSEISSSPGSTALRAGAAGGLVFADGHLFATRRVEQSYGVVEVKDVDDVGVGLGSTMLTKTDEKGLALVPNLGAYTPNQIRLNPQDLPISADMDTIEKIVVPRLRSAVKIDFPIRAGRAALVQVVFDDGEPAPPGATIRVDGSAQEFIVARRGEAFVSGLEARSSLQLEWNGQHCNFDLALPPPKRDDIARAGNVLCKGVKR